ncbi:MAG: DUF255 domain-containing protein, partial [Gammaproteobacteria bacterium]|nr:DUF255 domain-containing protein [Gammaproteobacteria bacterium]
MLKKIAVVLFLLPAGASGAAGIEWHQWSTAPFKQASAQNKLILIDVGMEGCTACRRMDEVTFTHPAVIKLIQEHFVAIAVDSEARPDIGERYSDWAWPALIFLAPDSTQVLALRGNRVPKNFIPILEELIAKQRSGELSPDKLAPYGAPPKAQTTKLTLLRDRVRAQLDRTLNEDNGGWGTRGVRTAAGARLNHLYLRAHMYDQEQLRSIALKTTQGYRRALDPVWGGVFVLVLNDGRIIPEKRISNQANAIVAFSNAYQLTGDKSYLDSTKAVDKYVVDWMMSADGTFYTSQEDDAPGLPFNMDARDYYALDSGEERRRYGIPPIDHAVYTDKNGEVISAYVRAYEASREGRYLATAVRTAEALLTERMQKAGWMLQTVPTQVVKKDKRMRPLSTEVRPYLSAQAWFGRAMLSLYGATGEQRWLEAAQTIASALTTHLQDDTLGGFYSSPPDETA